MTPEEQIEDAAAPPTGNLLEDLRGALRGTQRDYTSGPVGRAVLLLAVPMVLETLAESIFAVVDIFFVSKLGGPPHPAVLHAPFDDTLYLIEVAERSEPTRLAYEDVAEQVREDYLIRFAQRLTREVVESRLTDADFRFFEDEARRLFEGAL